MLTISVTTNVADLTRQLDAVQSRQLPFALAHALTMTAQRVKDAEVREMREVFDRPKPYTLGSLYTRRATKTNLESLVGIKPDSPTERALVSEIEGGERAQKPFEKALRGAGLLPPGYFAVPGSAAKLDAYGNMERSQITEVLRYLQAHKTGNLTAKRKARLAKGTKARQGFVYFLGAPAGGRLPLGVWQRSADGKAIRPIIIFVPNTHYRRLYQFYLVGEATVRRDFEPQFRASLADALASARAS